MKIGDIEIPGFLLNGQETTKKFSDVSNAVLNEVLNGVHDPVPDHTDEAGIFAAGVRAMEHTIQIARLMEGRVRAYRAAIASAQASADSIDKLSNAAAGRLQSIGIELSKARHDVGVSKALLAEETARIAGINARRDEIVMQHVSFVAFYRPRTAETLVTMPARGIDPGVTEAAVPTALARDASPPDELRAFVDLLRNAPLRWFIYIPRVLNWLDRLDSLHGTLQYAKQRANFKLFQAPEAAIKTDAGPFGPYILNAYNGHKQVAMQKRLQMSNLDLSIFTGRTWKESRDLAPDFISMGDLIDAGNIHPDVPRAPAAEIANILKVASALYSDFAAVLPAIRLDWAERLIAIDGPANLSNLNSLPRFGDVPILERREMQALTDWLYSRIDLNVPDAAAHMNDLIRVCILLASHAPVAEIVAGDVIRATPVFVGGRIELSADLRKVRVGMHVLMYAGGQTVAQGIVEDLAGGKATARILAVAAGTSTLERSAKVQYAAPAVFERNATTAGRLLL